MGLYRNLLPSGLGMRTYHKVSAITLCIATSTMAASLLASEYPSRWPALMETSRGECASVTGVYQYYGEWGDPAKDTKNGRPLIDGSIFSRPPVRGRTVYIDHNMKSGILHFRIVGGDPARSSFSEQLTCRGNWLVQSIGQSGYGDGTRADTKGMVRLARASDGSLVVHDWEHTRFRYFFFFGSSRSYEGWYRFLPAGRH